MIIPLLQPTTPCEIEGRNLKRHYTEPAIGKVYRLSFEVDKELWDAFELVPRSAEIRGVLWWLPDGPEFVPEKAPEPPAEPKPAKPKQEKGPYGQYWFAMHRPDGYGANFTTFPDLQEALEVDADHVHDALKAILGASSLTFVSPRQFEDFVTANGLNEGLISLSKRCEVWAMEHAK